MVTSNVEKEDGILNGSIGLLKAVSTKPVNHKSVPELLCMLLDDETAGKKARKKFVRTHERFCAENWTSIEKVVRDFPVGLSVKGGNRFTVEWKQFPMIMRKASRTISSTALRQITLNCVLNPLHRLAYVDLTGCRTETGTSLVSEICMKDFRVDQDIK